MAIRPVGRDPAFRAALALALRAAPARSPIVFVGPTGSGKSLFAKMVHERGSHPQAPYLEWAAAGVPATLFESELLGVERGTATGVDAHAGVFEAAGRGTLCLSGLEEIPLAQQAAFLRVLETGAIHRVGGHRPMELHCRILASFQHPPEMLAAEGRLRPDLRFRLEVLRIELPPLSTRGGDIALLTHHFLKRACRLIKRPLPQVADSLLEAFAAHPWPGDVRELEQRVEALALLGSDRLTEEDLPPSFWSQGDLLGGARQHRLTLADLKHAYIREVLAEVGGNRTEAAKWLGISRKALWEHLKRSDG